MSILCRRCRVGYIKWRQKNENKESHSCMPHIFSPSHDDYIIMIILLTSHRMATSHGLNAGLFNRSIQSSGSVFTPWAFQEDPYYQAWTFAKIFNCWTDSRSLIRCLRERSASELISAASSNGYWFRPVVDKNLTRPLLKDFPRNLYERGEFARVPLLSGLVRNEGTLDYYKRYHLIKNSQNGNNKWAIEELIRPYVRRFTNLKVISTAIDYNYIQKYNNSMMGANRGGYGRQSGSIIPTNPNYHNGFILNQDEKFSEVSSSLFLSMSFLFVDMMPVFFASSFVCMNRLLH